MEFGHKNEATIVDMATITIQYGRYVCMVVALKVHRIRSLHICDIHCILKRNAIYFL